MRRNKSNILKLPEPIAREIDKMLLEVGGGRKTYEQIVSWVADQGWKTSTSALSRYFKYIQALEKVRIVSQQVKAILDETQGDSPLELEEGVSKLGATVMMEVLQEAMSGEKIDVKHIGRLMGDFARLQSATIQREKLKEEFSKKAKKAALDISQYGKNSGLSDEVVEEIRKRILGLA